MSGVWNRTLVYLGLREEPEEAYDGLPERFDPDQLPDDEPLDRPVEVVLPDVEAGDNVRSLHTGDVRIRPTVAPLARAAVVEIDVFDDVEAVGARYRTGQPVLFDVSRADTVTSRRVVDFVSGMTYALRGELSKIGAKAFLAVPEGSSLSADEQRRLADLGYRLPTGSEP